MYCLISPQEPAYWLSSWSYDAKTDRWNPVYTAVADSYSIAEVAPAPFDVAPPLFWKECGSEVVADTWYFNYVTDQILQVPPPAPLPTADQPPTVEGAQTL
jgi:hypothetical protein